MGQVIENEKKKEYLREYRGHVRRFRRIEAEIAELRIMKTSVSVKYDGMPHGSSQNDMSGYAAELDQMEQDLIRERDRRVASYKETSSRIKSLSSENERDVLFYRYIKGLDWWEIAEKMGYSERQIHRYHGKALVHFEMSEEKDVIECQANV